MSRLSELVEQTQLRLASRPPPGDQTVATVHDRYDTEDWRQVFGAAREVRRIVEDLGERYDYTQDLVEGVFHWMIKAVPELQPAERMRPSRLANRFVTEIVAGLPVTEELRTWTTGQPYSAASAILGLSGELAEVLEKLASAAEAAEAAQQRAEAAADAAGEAAGAAAEAEQAQGDADGSPAASGAGPPEPTEQTEQQAAAAAALQNALAELDAAEQAEQAAMTDLQEQLIEARPQATAAARRAVKEAVDEATEEQAAMVAAGVDPGQARRMSFEERKALAEQLANRRLRQIAAFIGRFRIEARAEQARRVHVGREVFVDVENGRDLSRVLGSEIAKLAGRVRALRLDALVRFSQGRLLQRRYEGTERAADGTIVAVVDTSGSMMWNLQGLAVAESSLDPSRDAWAKAITLCLYDSARRRRRDFYAILFSSFGEQRHYEFRHGHQPRVYQRVGGVLEDVEVVGADRLTAAVVDLITYTFGGGTDFEEPLTQALDVIERLFDVNGRPKADIAFITDDDGFVSEEFMARYDALRRRVGVRTYGFAVGCSVGNALTAVSDNVRSLRDLASTDEVRDVFRAI